MRLLNLHTCAAMKAFKLGSQVAAALFVPVFRAARRPREERIQRCPRGEQGATLVLAAIMILALFILVAALLEASRFFGSRSEIDIAAQAGAFAGALAVIGGDALGASDEAVAYAVANGADAAAMSKESAFAFGVWDPVSLQFQPQADASGANAIRVIATQTKTTLSAPFLGSPTFAVSASAIVLYGTAVTETTCNKPIAVAASIIDTDADGYMTQAELEAALAQGTIVIRPAEHVEGAPSFYYSIVLPPFWKQDEGYVAVPEEAMGGNAYRTNLGSCNPDLLAVGDSLWTKPGNIGVPTIQGLTTLCGVIDGQGNCNPSGAGNPYGQPGVPVILPLWDDRVAPMGRTGLKVVSLGAFRIIKVIQQANEVELQGYFIRMMDSGAVEPGVGLIQRPILVR